MNIIRTVSSMIFPIITFPYTSRILGPEGIGKISFAISFVGYFTLFASIGIPMYGIREIARVKKDKKKLAELTQELFLMHFITTISVSFLFILLIMFNGKLSNDKVLFFVTSLSILFSSLSMEWFYQGMEEYSYITIRTIIFSTISAFAIFIFINDKQDYILSAAITVFASFGSSILNFYNARKTLFTKRTVPWDFKRHLKPLVLVYLMNFIISIYIQLDTVMLGFMSSSKNVGYYATGIKLNKLLLALVTSLGVVLLPRLSFFIANDMKEEFKRVLKKSFEVIWIFCLPIVASMFLLSDEIIVLFAGKQYLPASICVMITSPIVLFIGLTNILGIQILYPMGKDKEVIYAVASGAIFSLILNLLLIPNLTYVGAAIATLISEFVVLIVLVLLISKEYRMLMPYNSILKYLFATLLLVLFIFVIKMEITLFWLRLIVIIPTGVLLYFGMLLILKESLAVEFLTIFKKRFGNV
jgi:O-antigen/teichoic acid export membrane protein